MSTFRSVLQRIRENPLVELIVIVALAIGLALGIQAVLVKPYRIPSESMEPTLDVGQRVLVSRVNYRISDPDRGDVVVFHPPTGAEDNTCGAQHAENQLCPRPNGGKDEVNFIKRIVAMPGRHAVGAQRARGGQREARRRSRTSDLAHPEPAISRIPSRFRPVTFL